MAKKKAAAKKKTTMNKAPVTKSISKSAAGKKSTAKKAVAKKKAAPKKAAPKKPAAIKKSTAKKAAPKKAAVKKSVAKKKAAPKKKAATKKKTAVKKAAPKKSAVKKAAAPAKGKAKAAKKSKKPLTHRDRAIQGIRADLVIQKEILLTEAEQAMNALPEQTVFPDLGDQATAETDRNFMLRLRGREQRLLNKIDEAIEKIDSSKFGICEACGEEIEINRLRARPVASLCIECKTEQEEEEKLQGS